MTKRTDVVSESTFAYSGVFALITLFIPYYIPVMMLVTFMGASFIELIKYISGRHQNYSVWTGIGMCTLLGYLTPFYLIIKLFEFFSTFDPSHLDFTGDICKKPEYYAPIAFISPLLFVGSFMLFYPLYSGSYF